MNQKWLSDGGKTMRMWLRENEPKIVAGMEEKRGECGEGPALAGQTCEKSKVPIIKEIVNPLFRGMTQLPIHFEKCHTLKNEISDPVSS
jgi:hypothetical protein